MTFIKINDTLYPATISARLSDREWDGRMTRTITLTMTVAQAKELFVDDVAWSIVEQYEEDDATIQEESDCSEFCMAGDVVDHRDGTISIKMGKITDAEMLNIITGGAM